jgi:hypothetical protein
MVVLGIQNHWLNGIEPRTITSVLVYTKYFYFQLYILLCLVVLKMIFIFFKQISSDKPSHIQKQRPHTMFLV